MNKPSWASAQWAWIIASIAALALSVLWLFVWPEQRALGRGPLRYYAVRWGHSLCWLCLFAASVFRLFGNHALTIAWAGIFARLGGVFYFMFMAAAFFP